VKCWLAGLAILGVLTMPAWGQSDVSFKDPRFMEGMREIDDGKFAKAREIAEKMLAEDPKSYTATYLIGRVFFYGEGSIPRANFAFKQAKQELEAIWGPKPPNNGPFPLHSMIFQQLILSPMQLEEYNEELRLIDEYSKLYTGMEGQKGWPMLKLGKVEEAREMMKSELERAASPQSRSHILNTLGNLEFETDHMADSYNYFVRLCKEFEGVSDADPVYWTNAGETARDQLKFDDAEKLFIDASGRFNQYTYSDPWRFLAELYVSQGRLPEAVNALKEMQTWRLSSSAQVSQNKWAETLSTSGIVLLSLGYDKEAYDIFERLNNRPDRNSAISTVAPLMEGRNLYFYSLGLRAYRQRLLEERSWSDWPGWFRLTASAWQIERKISLTETRSADLICGQTGMVDLVSPFGPRSLDRPWLAPGLWRLFGTGPMTITTRGLIQAWKSEDKLQKTYLQSVLAETLAVDGQYKEAEELLNGILQDLPPREVALRTRAQANLVRALEGQGRPQEALHYYRQVMEKDPSLLRQFELRLPIRFESSGDLAGQAVSRLRSSPRFRSDEGAFVATLSSQGEGLTAQLLGPDGTVLKTFTTAAGADAAATLGKFCEEFHAEVFAPVIDLSQADIHSIDSSPSVGGSKQLEKMMSN
jgi:tetratricopeptide (TPR) repeat protein